jgi:hypothetical protein
MSGVTYFGHFQDNFPLVAESKHGQSRCIRAGTADFPREEIGLIVPLATLKALPLGTMLARFTVPLADTPALPT